MGFTAYAIAAGLGVVSDIGVATDVIAIDGIIVAVPADAAAVACL